MNLLWAAFFLQVLIYLAIVYLVLKLFFSTRREIAWLFFIFSPAFIFLFPFYDMRGAFRKEIIVFLSFCLLAVGLMNGRFRQRYVFPSLLAYAVAVFSHELATLCVVFFIYMLFESTRSDPALRRIGRIYITGFLAIAVAGFIFSFVYSGTATISSRICQSLQYRGLTAGICRGAIDWLGFDQSYGWNQVSIRIYGIVYPPLFLLATIPLFLTDWWSRRLPVLLAGFASLAPLFLVAIDWGRWIHIYFVMVFILLLFDSCHMKIAIHKLPLIVVALYAGLWSIPHITWQMWFGFFGIYSFAYRVAHKLSSLL